MMFASNLLAEGFFMFLVLLLGVVQAADDCSDGPPVIGELTEIVGQRFLTNRGDSRPRSAEKAPLWRDFPYFYQYNNSKFRGSSCQNTSVAMVLRHYGVDVTPDDISRRFGKDLAQSPEGLARVFNTYAKEAGIKQRITAHRDGTMADVDALLSSGKPVIVHGYFTSYGHVVVALGKTSEGYVVNDPAGKWSQSWKGGYAGKTDKNGRRVVYDSASFKQAVGTSDGRHHLPVWYHEITP